MISTRTGKDPVTPFLTPWSDPAPAGASRQPRLRSSNRSRTLTSGKGLFSIKGLTSAITAICHFDRSRTALSSGAAEKPAFPTRARSASPSKVRPFFLRFFTTRQRILTTALLGSAASVTLAVSVTAMHHYRAPSAPLAAPPTALTRVPSPVQAIASANHRHNRFTEALFLNKLGNELSTLHPIRSIERPLAALGNPLRGIATWYGDVLQGHRTASGESFNDRELTAAHKTLPLGTVVRVTDTRTQRSVVVRINDRGTLAPGRIIDLSSAAAEQLGILRAGIANVKLEVLHRAAQS